MKLYSVKLYGVKLYGVKLYGVKLYGVKLYDVKLYGVNSALKLYGVKLYGVKLYGVKISSGSKPRIRHARPRGSSNTTLLREQLAAQGFPRNIYTTQQAAKQRAYSSVQSPAERGGYLGTPPLDNCYLEATWG